MSKELIVAIVLAVLVVFIGLLYWPPERGGPGPFGPSPVACTTDALICPDGSAVGRTGPNCEFAACPKAMPIEGWRTLEDGRLSYQYPPDLGTSYISVAEWPPRVTFRDSYSCLATERRVINSREYCVTAVSEGAAGSVYTEYSYAFPRGPRTAVLSFTLRTPQCANYAEPQRSACEAERDSFDPDVLAGRIAESLRVE
ncbi:MAG TPA: hypothetical protein VD967_01980 [Candidatus Paceibacterota bacterium]|nr:hypothetical protein [Candidatus Paceibacterota bacterium]